MNEFELAVAGRLSALEYVLEVLMANQLAFMPPQDSEAFKQALATREGYIKRGPIDVDVMQLLAVETAKCLQGFLAKVSEREEQLRDLHG